jgi:hypothetical protein
MTVIAMAVQVVVLLAAVNVTAASTYRQIQWYLCCERVAVCTKQVHK